MVNTMIKTSSGNIYFDAVLNTDHNTSVTPTEHPVQSGASISDHAFVNPPEITLEIGNSDVHHTDGYSAQSFQRLEAIMEKRDLVTLVTRLNTYTDMLITSISVPDNYETLYGLKATIIFKHIKVVTVATVQVQPTVSGSKNPKSQSDTPSKTAKEKKAQADSEAQRKQSILRQQQEAAAKKKAQEEAIPAAAGKSFWQKIGDAVKTTVTKVTSFVQGVVSAVTSVAKTSTKTTTTPSATVKNKVISKTTGKNFLMKA